MYTVMSPHDQSIRPMRMKRMINAVNVADTVLSHQRGAMRVIWLLCGKGGKRDHQVEGQDPGFVFWLCYELAKYFKTIILK